MSTSATSFLVKNVALPNGELRNVRFAERTDRRGETFIQARTRGLPKLIIRQTGPKSVIGHLNLQRKSPLVETTSAKSAFVQMVETVWGNAKAAKKATPKAAPVKAAHATKKAAAAPAKAPRSAKKAPAAPAKSAKKGGRAVDLAEFDAEGFPNV